MQSNTHNLYLVNGFLGSGKTTAIANACMQLISQKIKPAVITNDQGVQQVDSAYIQSLSLPGKEVADGCFCCRYNELEQAIAALTTTVQPEIIFAESVGSCTDLIATIAKPFALRHHNSRIVISVFADAYLMYSIIKGTACFIEESVQYIYKKQLEEADIIVINKTDLLTKEKLMIVKETVESGFTSKKIICINANDENDINKWLQALKEFTVPAHRNSLGLDYDIYGAGEAMLAWLDQKISVHTQKHVAVHTALILIHNIYNNIQLAGYTIGHLKFLLSDDDWHKKISYTTTGIKEDHAETELHLCKHLDVLINARVQTSPQQLHELIALAMEETIALTGCRIVNQQLSAFQPGYPKPLHRMPG